MPVFGHSFMVQPYDRGDNGCWSRSGFAAGVSSSHTYVCVQEGDETGMLVLSALGTFTEFGSPACRIVLPTLRVGLTLS